MSHVNGLGVLRMSHVNGLGVIWKSCVNVLDVLWTSCVNVLDVLWTSLVNVLGVSGMNGLQSFRLNGVVIWRYVRSCVLKTSAAVTGVNRLRVPLVINR